MNSSKFRLISATALLATAVACTGAKTVTSTTNPTPTTPTPVTPPTITVSAPNLVGPASGTVAFGWPTFTWENASKTNTTNALIYRFDLSARDDFATVAHSATVSEGSGQTSYTPPSTVAAPAEGTLYWRVVAIDQANAVQSQPSSVLSFAYYENTDQNRVAQQLYGGLWGSVRPSGAHGRARFGPGWDVATKRSFDGVTFQSPPLEVLRIYDLLDTGMNPDQAIGWMRSNGYPTVAVYYASVQAIGFPYQYMALISGAWELVHRVGA